MEQNGNLRLSPKLYQKYLLLEIFSHLEKKDCMFTLFYTSQPARTYLVKYYSLIMRKLQKIGSAIINLPREFKTFPLKEGLQFLRASLIIDNYETFIDFCKNYAPKIKKLYIDDIELLRFENSSHQIVSEFVRLFNKYQVPQLFLCMSQMYKVQDFDMTIKDSNDYFQKLPLSQLISLQILSIGHARREMLQLADFDHKILNLRVLGIKGHDLDQVINALPQQLKSLKIEIEGENWNKDFYKELLKKCKIKDISISQSKFDNPDHLINFMSYIPEIDELNSIKNIYSYSPIVIQDLAMLGKLYEVKLLTQIQTNQLTFKAMNYDDITQVNKVFNLLKDYSKIQIELSQGAICKSKIEFEDERDQMTKMQSQCKTNYITIDLSLTTQLKEYDKEIFYWLLYLVSPTIEVCVLLNNIMQSYTPHSIYDNILFKQLKVLELRTLNSYFYKFFKNFNKTLNLSSFEVTFLDIDVMNKFMSLINPDTLQIFSYYYRQNVTFYPNSQQIYEFMINMNSLKHLEFVVLYTYSYFNNLIQVDEQFIKTKQTLKRLKIWIDETTELTDEQSFKVFGMLFTKLPNLETLQLRFKRDIFDSDKLTSLIAQLAEIKRPMRIIIQGTHSNVFRALRYFIPETNEFLTIVQD